jgi:hypothetical protein
MLDDLDRTLRTLLETGLPPVLREQVTITFAAPDAKFPPPTVSLPAIDLFLYDVRENRELRSNEPVRERTPEGRLLQRLAPVRVDCSYLVSAWAAEGHDTAASEHAVLGEVLRVFVRTTAIPEGALQGALRNDVGALPLVSLQPGRLQSIAELWQAAGSRPKAALHLTVTVPVWPQDAREVPVVTERVLKIGVATETAS